MKTLTTTWTGVRPMILHNGLKADPTNPLVRQLKAITSKRNKTDADHEAISRLEWEASLYRGANGALVIPTDNIERCIQLGAQRNKLGKSVAAAVLVAEAEVLIQYEGPKSLDALYANPLFSLRRGVKVTTSRVIRVRPMIPTGWKLAFTLDFDDEVIDEENLRRAMVEAGALVGLGDWRPKFGHQIT